MNNLTIYKKLCHIMPGGVNSPARAFKDVGGDPLVITSGKGARICDADHKSYIDYCASWGAIVHGHANAAIIEAVICQLEKGSSFGMTTEIEGALAEQIAQCMPSMESMRFVSSGTEAAMTAVRLARGVTGRDYIVKFNGNYHGHADAFLVQAGSAVWNLNGTASSSGVPQAIASLTLSLPYNDVDFLKSCFAEWGDKIAAVIVEPIAANMGVVPASQEFLQAIRDETQKAKALLIFDEVISGFRVAKGGAQELFKITPDLTCLGKIIGGGFPVAAFGGKKGIMNMLAPLGTVFQAGTLSGNPIAMAAGLAALKLLKVDGFYQTLAAKTKRLVDPIEKCLDDQSICLNSMTGLFTLFFGVKKARHAGDVKLIDRGRFTKLFAYLLERGVLAPPSPQEAWFLTMAHSDEDLERTSQLICDYIKRG